MRRTVCLAVTACSVLGGLGAWALLRHSTPNAGAQSSVQDLSALVFPDQAMAAPVPAPSAGELPNPISPFGVWCLSMAGITILLVLVGSISAASSDRWLQQKLVAAIKNLPTDAQKRAESDLRPSALQASPEGFQSNWVELEEIVDHVVELRRQLQRTERETQRQMREQEIGFGRVLRRAEDRATTDVLTGLRNRAFLNAELKDIVARQKTAKQDLAIVMIDVDNFKVHNDTLGHKAGDELLSFLGELLRGTIRPTDYAIRYAGDEFLLLLLGVGKMQAASIVERIVKLFGQYAATLASSNPPSLSAGIASLRESPRDEAPALIALADRALYKAKKMGKNAVVTCAAAA